MRPTIKRDVVTLPSAGENRSRHFNQMAFKGIVQHNNLYEVDQTSFKRALNVYIDEDKTLVSRPPIIVSKDPVGYTEDLGGTTPHWIIPKGSHLIDVRNTGMVTIYVSQDYQTKVKTIVAYNQRTEIVQVLPITVTDYHIATLHQFIIVFNDIEAHFINIDKYTEGWALLRDHAEIPITKRIIGQNYTDYPANQFTKSYKEEYLWGPDVLAMLPDATTEVLVNQIPTSLKWTLDHTNLNTEARILRQISVALEDGDIISTKTNASTHINLIAVSREQYFLLSIDEGLSFEKILYPAHSGYLRVASISEDALYYFFVAQDGVYRYDITNRLWVRIQNDVADYSKNLVGLGLNNLCKFLNGETFSFVLYQEELNLPVARIYWKAPNLQYDEYPADTLGVTTISGENNPTLYNNLVLQDIAPTHINFIMTEDTTRLLVMLPGMTARDSVLHTIVSDKDKDLIHYTYPIDYPSLYIHSVETKSDYPESKLTLDGYLLKGVVPGETHWQDFELIVGQLDNPEVDDEGEVIGLEPRTLMTLSTVTQVPSNALGAPLRIGSVDVAHYTTYSIDGEIPIVTKKNDEVWPANKSRLATLLSDDYYIIIVDNIMYTTLMIEDNDVTLTYTHIDDTPYTLVPSNSHDNNELYFSYGNKLYITDNLRTHDKMMFNLPEINNHHFTSPVTELINVSSTEVAIFLETQLHLVVQVPDEILGFRYDYYNSRLSAGLREGDNVINTIDGTFTIYPAQQGLAVMQYQSQMATTDQTIEYLSDNVPKLWRQFYQQGLINISQHKDYLYLANGTTTYLMLDLRNMSWWEFESPVTVARIVCDADQVYLLGSGFYQYDNNYTQYKDLHTRTIQWYTTSQPLHFGLPNHYKSIRQLIFQFEESTNIAQTIITQIKLYRKTITYREPEAILFKVDNYRTFVKRFNYWKINELQWTMGYDADTATPSRLKLNGISIKYEIGEEVR